jgi:hypothetical protein
MMMSIRRTSIVTALLILTTAAHVHGATPDEPGGGLEDFLNGNYYRIEFLVFERPAVTEFATMEVLGKSGGNPFPANMRTQRLEGEVLEPAGLSGATRACLTFPTLSYELEPEEEDAGPDLTDAAPEETEVAISEAPAFTEDELLPVPEIRPFLESDPLLDLMAAVAAFERDLEAANGLWLDPDSFLLAPDASRIQRRGLGRPLYHGAWIQVVPPREAPEPILIQAGNRLTSPSVHELEGTVDVTLGRYLHFRADLSFHAPALGAEPVRVALAADGTPGAAAPEAPPFRHMRLAESRRMRSEEVHYLDHPKLGVLVRIDPVELPRSLIDAFEALEEDVE